MGGLGFLRLRHGGVPGIPVEDYDFVFWIDADAIFYDQRRRIEEALHLEAGCTLERLNEHSGFCSFLLE